MLADAPKPRFITPGLGLKLGTSDAIRRFLGYARMDLLSTLIAEKAGSWGANWEQKNQKSFVERTHGGQRSRTAVADEATRRFDGSRPVPTGNTLQTLWSADKKRTVCSVSESVPHITPSGRLTRMCDGRTWLSIEPHRGW
jgi:hypothetical protein